MRSHKTRSVLLRTVALPLALAAAGLLGPATEAGAQISSGADINLSQKTAHDSECAIAKNPSNKLQLFALCNTREGLIGGGLFAARSINGGASWTFPDAADKTIADGDANQGAAACCDPNLAWDTFGNLFATYIDAGLNNIVTIVSTDAGLTWSPVISFGPASVDQPTVIAANTTAPGAPVALWIVWNQGGQMVARGAPVTGLGTVGAFTALQTAPGTAGCSFGDLAVSPAGVVVQTCESPNSNQGPANILVNIDADGLGAGNFGAAITATATNVGGFDFIPPQSARSVDAEAGLAYDINPMSPHVGRLYLVYTDETVNENNDTDIMLRFSDNDGSTWSAAQRVNDDATTRSQFLPRIATNRLSGNVGVCWHDARNSAGNTAMQVFCTMATPAGAAPTFMTSGQVGDALSTSLGTGNPSAAAIDFGDYAGMAYFQGRMHPIWADSSNSAGGNPDATATFEAYTDTVGGGVAANEGDPHLTTVNGHYYDFQPAGEFVSLRSFDGLEIQTRQTPIATTFLPGPDSSGLRTCVSLNTAVAMRLAGHRVSFQPSLTGVPDPAGMQLRIDGVLTTLGPGGMAVGAGGHLAPSANGGIRADFPNGTALVVTPGWWPSQSKWYLNVDAYATPSTEGILGVVNNGTWLPALPTGASMGPMPVSLHQRYVDLNQTYANAWRVSDKSSLFDYAPGTSTKDFTYPQWPIENPQQCVVPKETPAKPLDLKAAEVACQAVRDERRHANCVFDVRVTGEVGFAKTYGLTERLAVALTPKLGPNKARPMSRMRPTVVQKPAARPQEGGPD